MGGHGLAMHCGHVPGSRQHFVHPGGFRDIKILPASPCIGFGRMAVPVSLSVAIDMPTCEGGARRMTRSAVCGHDMQRASKSQAGRRRIADSVAHRERLLALPSRVHCRRRPQLSDRRVCRGVSLVQGSAPHRAACRSYAGEPQTIAHLDQA